MAFDNRSPRLAVLIDADNASAKIADGLFEEIAKIGEASVRRIYGDFSAAPEGLGRRPFEARHHPAAAVRLHDRQERLRHRAGHRCHGPAAQRPLRRLLPGLVRQRLHPACRPHPRAGRGCLRVRRAKDAGEFPPGLPPVHLHREPAADRAGKRLGCRSDGKAASAAERRNADHQEVIAQMESEDGWVPLGAVGNQLANLPRISTPGTLAFVS